MALTESHYTHLVNALLPRGPIWFRRVGSTIDAVLYALAMEAARVDERAHAVIEESDPRTSTEELSLWFEEWGIPSECLAAIADPSREQMRQERLAKITSNLGLTAAFFESLAGTLGFHAKVESTKPFTCASRVDHGLFDDSWSSVMTLIISIEEDGGLRYFDVSCGVDEPLGRWGNALLECMIRALAPAHVFVIFFYGDKR